LVVALNWTPLAEPALLVTFTSAAAVRLTSPLAAVE
jgi:hypothetical protein